MRAARVSKRLLIGFLFSNRLLTRAARLGGVAYLTVKFTEATTFSHASVNLPLFPPAAASVNFIC